MHRWITKLITVSFCLVFGLAPVYAQQDLLDELEETAPAQTDLTIATFKSTRLVSGHSVETNAQGVLQFLVGHRFGRFNEGPRNLFGLDNASIRLGFSYGILENLNVEIGRSSFEKTYDASLKWRFLRQKTGAKPFPFTATGISAVYLAGQAWSNPDRANLASSRYAYHYALLLARKFGRSFSLQLMPTLVHRNLVLTAADQNTVFSMGAGASLKITPSLRLNAEYYYIPTNQIVSLVGGEQVRNAFSIGVDLETGGHVFQMHLTNSRGMTERFLVGGTTGDWLDGGIHFGFNVSRVFTVQKPKKI